MKDTNSRTYPVLLAFDKNFLGPATVTIHSLIKNNPDLNFSFYIICQGSENSWLKPIEEFVKKKGASFTVKEVGFDSLKNVKVELHFSVATYLRLFSADLISEDKALYLDTDIIVNGSVSDLFNVELGDHALAAVSDPKIEDFGRLELSTEEGYFNSGMIVLNLNKWREMQLGAKALEYIFKYPDKIKYADQCGLNAVLKGEWLRLDPKWNVQTSFFDNEIFSGAVSQFGKEKFQNAIKNPIIIHYTEASKPWHFQNKHPLKDLYWTYLNETEYAQEFKNKYGLKDYVKWGIPKSIKKRYWRYLKNKN